MFSILYFLIFQFVITYRLIKGKAITAWLMTLAMLSPKIVGVDSLYIVIPWLILLYLMFRRTTKIAMPKYLIQFSAVVLWVFVIYSLSWMFLNRNDLSSFILREAGLAKLLLIIILCYNIDYKVNSYNVWHEVYKLIKLTIFINIIVVIYQVTNTTGAIGLLQGFLGELSNSYLQSVTQYGYFSRYSGLFAYPMSLGVFTLFAYVFLLFYKERLDKYNLITFVGTLVLGFMSSTKTFVLGFVVFTIIWVITMFISKKIKLTNIFLVFVLMGLFMYLSLNFEVLVRFVAENFGQNFAYYLNFLKEPMSAFNTRYSEEATLIGYMPEFISRYWFMGVGPASINGEFTGDSAVYELMHNGGALVLIPVIGFYINLALVTLKRKQLRMFCLISALLITGIGFNTWIGDQNCLWMYYLIVTGQSIAAGKKDSYSENQSVIVSKPT